MAEAFWQYADHYFRMIQTQGCFVQRDNQGWGDGKEGQPNPQHQGPSDQLQQANINGQAYSEHQGGGRDDQGGRAEQSGREVQGDSEPGLGGVGFSSIAAPRRATIKRRMSNPRCRRSRRPRVAGAADRCLRR